MIVKVLGFPPVSGASMAPISPLLPQSAHWALETQALYLRPQNPIEAHQRLPQGRDASSLTAPQPVTC